MGTFVGGFHLTLEGWQGSPSFAVERLPVVLLGVGQLLVSGLGLSRNTPAGVFFFETQFLLPTGSSPQAHILQLLPLALGVGQL